MRSTRDQPDDQPGAYQIHILYVEPPGAAGRRDVDGSLRRSVTAWREWMARQTGGPKLRFDTCDGVLDVTYVKLPPGQDQLARALGSDDPDPDLRGPTYFRDRLERDLKQTFHDSRKLYLVYYEGLALGPCANAAQPPGRFAAVYLDGRYETTPLTAAAPAGATTIEVYDPSEIGGLPQVPFEATLGKEKVKVKKVARMRVTLDSGLVGPHPIGTLLQAENPPLNCREHKFSADGQALGFLEFTGAHESLHLLGIVSKHAPNHNDKRPQHLKSTSQGGTNDLMYQGDSDWGCGNPKVSAPCVLDPANKEYFRLPPDSQLPDLAKSVFLELPPPGAKLPPSW
ncbi:MAG TPA: hypothetical protein VF121_19700 [Thermoanaerobaculia bacterium]|nr:hypothetical protein [Thermoanaerobaculia bacterium]